MPALIDALKGRARQLNAELYALYLAYKDPRVPSYARIFAACVVGYAFSPIDLIPDPIPILGYLDDFVIIPLGIWLALKMIPAEVMTESRLKAREGLSQKKPVNWVVGAIILVVWLGIATLAVRWGLQFFEK